jgi:hypothetical protein
VYDVVLVGGSTRIPKARIQSTDCGEHLQRSAMGRKIFDVFGDD